MSALRQVVLGFLAALLSSALILGGISLALLQSGTSVALAPTAAPVMTEGPSMEITILPGQPTLTSLPPTLTETYSALLCQPPEGWVQIAAGPDVTMQSLADAYGLPVEVLAEANCLTPSSQIAGYTISVPAFVPTPTYLATATQRPTIRPTRTPLVCGRPYGWQVYVVQRGDTLTQIARAFYTSVAALQKANCLTGSLIRTGQILYVPAVATRTLTPTIAIPTTAVPTTAVPTTAVPTTAVPTTAVPTTAVPTTAVPTTAVPTTAVPTTAVPTTAVPTTAVPTTAVPTKVVPTIPAPTKVVPTTEIPARGISMSPNSTMLDPNTSSRQGLISTAFLWLVARMVAAIFWPASF